MSGQALSTGMVFTDSTLSHVRPNPLGSEVPIFDRESWKRMEFGEFAESIGERAESRHAREEAEMPKPKARRGKILFINAVNDVTRERAQTFLPDEQLERVVRAYQEFSNKLGYNPAVPIEEVRAKEGNLSISLYVGREPQAQTDTASETAATATTALPVELKDWLTSSTGVWAALKKAWRSTHE